MNQSPGIQRQCFRSLLMDPLHFVRYSPSRHKGLAALNLVLGRTLLHNMTTETQHPYQLLCIGNPLLDMQTSDGSLLDKYNLKPNDASRASLEQMGIYEDISNAPDIQFVAGGAAQNTARGTAVSHSSL
ncbi:adenosine kinase [Serendipita sp. 407]|nr:adenosine kinase [Serendipita sp. 407]